jgi:uncharacterized NAD(P)/FAD-binding protein YdhS
MSSVSSIAPARTKTTARRQIHLFARCWHPDGIVPNPIGKGLCTSEHGALHNADGATADWLLTLGPPRLGGLFETTAVPELRKQAEALALYLSSVIYEPIEIVPELFMAAGI